MDRQRMYTIKSVADLDSWAQRLGLSIDNDTELSLRRLQLLADEVNKNLLLSCDVCEARFKQKSHLLRHKRTSHNSIRCVTCPHCMKEFKRQDNLRRHIQLHLQNAPPECTPSGHEEQQIQKQHQKRKTSATEEGPCTKKIKAVKNPCNWCFKVKELLHGKKFCETCGEQGRECKWCHRPLPERFFSKQTSVCDSCINRRERFKNNQTGGGSSTSTSALAGTAVSTTLEPQADNLWDVLQFFRDSETNIENLLEKRLHSIKGIKWFMTLFVKFVKYDRNNEAVYAEPVFRSSSFALTNVSQIEEQLSEGFQNLHNGYQNFERDGSGWTIDKILKLQVNIAARVQAIRGQ